VLRSKTRSGDFKVYCRFSGKCSTDASLCGLVGVCPYTKHLLEKEGYEDVK